MLWSLLILTITTISLIQADVRPADYDAKDFEHCGKGLKHKPPAIKKPIDKSVLESDTVKKVIGGERVALGEMPWMTSIEITSKVAGTSWCTGALISSDLVLTAAHCFQKRNEKGKVVGCKRSSDLSIVVNVGATDMTHGSKKRERGIERKVKRIAMDENYYNGLCNADDLIIPVEEAAPICLLHRDQAATEMGNLRNISNNAYLSGFGHTLRLSHEVLNKVMTAPIIPCVWQGVPIVCSESIQAKGGCCGDSGAPLAVLLKGRYYAYGVFNRGINCQLPRIMKNGYDILAPRMDEVRRIINKH